LMTSMLQFHCGVLLGSTTSNLRCPEAISNRTRLPRIFPSTVSNRQ
jgi:hypothetical protein